jgi:hypothetical protein
MREAEPRPRAFASVSQETEAVASLFMMQGCFSMGCG